MAKKGKHIEPFHWVCTTCRHQNGISQRNKVNVEKEQLEGRKRYCPNCRVQRPHTISSKMK